jgi:RES domain-containing protein
VGTIIAWRITSEKYRNEAFTGQGAKEYGGRFNSVGTPVVYTAESLALATLELLANINKRHRLADHVSIPVSFGERLVSVRDIEDLPDRWDARPYGPASQRIGDQWIRSEESLVLRVPSVVVPQEHNYLIHPRHPNVESLEIGDPEPIDPDPRLLD